MQRHNLSRPRWAARHKTFGADWAGLLGQREPAAEGRPAAHRTRWRSIVFWTAVVGLAISEALLAAEQRIAGNRPPPAILVAPGPGGVAISSDDPQALEQFAELFAALASIRSNTKEETVVFYLKHAKAAAVAEILEAVLSGGSLAEEPQPGFAPFFGGFGPPGRGGFGPGGPFGGPMGFGSRFGRGGDTGFGPPTGASQGPEGRTPPASRSAARQRPATSSQTGSGVRITPDARLNALIVQAKPGDMDIIEELLKILDQQGTPEVVAAEPRPRLVPVRHVPVQSVLAVLRQVYQDRLTNAGAGPNSGARGGPDQAPGMQGPAGPGSPGFPQAPGGPGAGPAQFFQQLAMAAGSAGRRGRAAPGTEELPKMALSADTRSNSLVVVAPDRLFEEVRDLVRQLDRPGTDDAAAILVLALRNGKSELVRRALPAFMGDRVRVGQVAASPSANGRTMGGGPAGARRPGVARGEQPARPQVPGAGGSFTPAAGAPPGPSPTPGPSSPAEVGGQDRFGRRGTGGPPGPGAAPFSGGMGPGGSPRGAPFGPEGPPQPPGELPFRGAFAPGEGAPPALEPGPAVPPPGPAP